MFAGNRSEPRQSESVFRYKVLLCVRCAVCTSVGVLLLECTLQYFLSLCARGIFVISCSCVVFVILEAEA